MTGVRKQKIDKNGRGFDGLFYIMAMPDFFTIAGSIYATCNKYIWFLFKKKR